jgi:hypothetical protein
MKVDYAKESSLDKDCKRVAGNLVHNPLAARLATPYVWVKEYTTQPFLQQSSPFV